MVTSKVIFLLHCTGLAQLSFYASLVGAYNFTICNHTAIKTDYQNMLKNIIADELNKAYNINTSIKNCCTLKSQAELLGCIYNFTKANFTKANFFASGIWNFTNTLLKEHCHGNSEVNGSQNHRWTIPKPCNLKLKNLNNLILLELREMWYSYEAYKY
ncbi:hypothetical protein E2320_017400 [Naja naja]|nr:hypothetical protein E2320_017400 [Naja naja]